MDGAEAEESEEAVPAEGGGSGACSEGIACKKCGLALTDDMDDVVWSGRSKNTAVCGDCNRASSKMFYRKIKTPCLAPEDKELFWQGARLRTDAKALEQWAEEFYRKVHSEETVKGSRGDWRPMAYWVNELHFTEEQVRNGGTSKEFDGLGLLWQLKLGFEIESSKDQQEHVQEARAAPKARALAKCSGAKPRRSGGVPDTAKWKEWGQAEVDRYKEWGKEKASGFKLELGKFEQMDNWEAAPQIIFDSWAAAVKMEEEWSRSLEELSLGKMAAASEAGELKEWFEKPNAIKESTALVKGHMAKFTKMMQQFVCCLRFHWNASITIESRRSDRSQLGDLIDHC